LKREGPVAACYEAGVSGYDLYRQLRALGVACNVIAPALTPRRPGQRIKTDRRDAAKLVRLFRAGELTAIHVPDEAEEAVRDLVRCRDDIRRDVLRWRHRVLKLLARHGRSYLTGKNWSQTHWRWIREQRFDLPPLRQEYNFSPPGTTLEHEEWSIKVDAISHLQEEIHREHDFAQMVGSSEPLLAVLARVEKVAPTDSTVLITGETGTGKELIARAIHDQCPRRERPLVKVNCTAISAGLVESEFFGHVKGAFTGALERRIGRFQLADGGTIFLDEVGELPLETQVKLLRVLQEGEFEPVGGNQTLRVNVRVIAATNRDLRAAVEAGHFRADLFYRLNVVPVEIPPLRERRSDIPQLVTFFAARFGRRFGKRIESVAPASMERLLSYGWPGNIRELQNVVERAVVLASGPVLALDPEATPASSRPPVPGPAQSETARALDARGLPTLLENVERIQITLALEQSHGVIEGPRGAASLLHLHPNTLRGRMEKLGIRRPASRTP
jgi:transcriptional regulator with GAF, ATPase, and Fis domain